MMPHLDFNYLSFRRLGESGRSFIIDAMDIAPQRRHIIEVLIDYLQFRSTGYFDAEDIYLIGCELRPLWPAVHRAELISTLEEKLEERVTRTFLEGFGVTEERFEATTSSSSRPPSDTDLERLLRRIRRTTITSVEPEIREIFERAFAYTVHTGDANVLTRTAFRLGDAMLRPAESAREGRVHAADLVNATASIALEWAPWEERLWTLWARSFDAGGNAEAAELVYWEALRRLPEPRHAYLQLLQLLLRDHRTRNAETVALAREAAQRFKTPSIINQLARALLFSNDRANQREATDLLIAQIRRAASQYYDITVLASSALLIQPPPRSYEEIVARINDPVLLGRIGRAVARHDLARALEFFSRSYDRFPNDAPIANQVAVLRASTGGRADAIALLQATAQKHPDDPYSRLHLAELLAQSEDPAERAEARQLREYLVDHELVDENERTRLDDILSGIRRSELPTVIAPRESDEERTETSVIRSQAQLSPSIARLGELRRTRFRLEQHNSVLPEIALEELRRQLREDPTFAYAQLLAVRQGIWERSSAAIPSFPAAFELALQDRDRGVLDALAKHHPRLRSLILVAQAVLGDRVAAQQIDRILTNLQDLTKPSLETTLDRKFGPTLKLIGGGASISSASQKRLMAQLKEVNEAAIAGGYWSLAA
jgi:hypothetical protein